MATNLQQIRNFSIIAHIDHGKSTLADRILEATGALQPREMEAQVLDHMDLERERGITIKAKAVRLHYKRQGEQEYILNLIDTPGHVDFCYEVSRSLSACEGALLVIDAVQGVEAQTLANVHLAMEHDLTIIPVINKIDLPNADVARVKMQIEETLAIDASEAILCSAKQGIGTEEVIEAVIKRIPPPKGSPDAPLKALIFDSSFDPYQGVVMYVRLYDGQVRHGTRILLMSTGVAFEVLQVGVFTPQMRPADLLSAGEVGYIIAGIRDVRHTRVGDTITAVDRPTTTALPGFKEVRPMVFAGLYPTESEQYQEMKEALEKLRLNDFSFSFEPETSLALGFGFRCGFLGLLHMEIIQERLEREFDLTLITTAPTVVYRVVKRDGTVVEVDNPSDLPLTQQIERVEEPYIKASIMAPGEYIGPIFGLCQEKRGIQRGVEYMEGGRILITYDLPLNEIVMDFYDRLKSATRGYASLDYEFLDYREGQLAKLDILVNDEPVDALSCIVPKEQAHLRGRMLAERMRELIPRQLFEVVIQAALGGKVIARETVRPLRKNVTAKCYGGDISRKRKLLERQKEGKRRMKQVGRVEIPQEAFMAALKVKSP
ncbi:elongation factor 4 [Candidatus Methylomirabilis limnetica]|jgi:GTP-binding protein LepA|uniref:Elongation factor 4 n=1 Tax=Candidatus Methylomirabilis limnetica TaxID=2033718 RepID=A0A2T4TY75_9BACT|nr:translation elongation factor 4 [Candidatus Methylomirabilis limnetica]PTL36057.1 elongation factor 4 [Candidatus Methylomirabilis limnetica]